MHRRKFLKLLTLAGAGLAINLSFPRWASGAVRDVSYAGALYRSDGRGGIYKSTNAGATWVLHSDLGDIYSVSKLAVDRRNRLQATVGYAGRTFDLVLAPDMRSWLTT
jgi:hypothetical protein